MPYIFSPYGAKSLDRHEFLRMAEPISELSVALNYSAIKDPSSLPRKFPTLHLEKKSSDDYTEVEPVHFVKLNIAISYC